MNFAHDFNVASITARKSTITSAENHRSTRRTRLRKQTKGFRGYNVPTGVEVQTEVAAATRPMDLAHTIDLAVVAAWEGIMNFAANNLQAQRRTRAFGFAVGLAKHGIVDIAANKLRRIRNMTLWG